jgi:predicted HAD superfamily hydrolase
MTKRYLVTVKGGHVGTHRYYPITLPILAVSMEDASQKAILLPRVKHKSLQDVLAVLEVDEETLLAQCQANRENPYFTFTSDYVAKSWLQEHRHELMDDGSTGPTETRRHRRRKR